MTLYRDRPRGKPDRPPMGRRARILIFGSVGLVFAAVVVFVATTGQSLF